MEKLLLCPFPDPSANEQNHVGFVEVCLCVYSEHPVAYHKLIM